MTGLRELSVDNTLVSDLGITFISRLTGLDVLSLSDTRCVQLFTSTVSVFDQLISRYNMYVLRVIVTATTTVLH